MKKSLVKKYVAYKAAQIDFLLAEAKKVMKPEQYVKEVMSMKLEQIPVPLQRFLEKTISKRMGKEYTGSIYFAPTVGQWVDEMFGEFSAQDIISYLSQASGLKPKKLKKATIGDHVFDRPFLIELIYWASLALSRSMSMISTFRFLRFASISMCWSKEG